MGQFRLGLLISDTDFTPPHAGTKIHEKHKNYGKWPEMVENRSDLVDIDAELIGKIRGIRI